MKLCALLLLSMLVGCWHKPVHIKLKTGEVHVHKVGNEEHEFHWHEDVKTRSQRFSLVVAGCNLLEGLEETESTSTLREFRSFHRDGVVCIRTIARAYSGRTTADFWVYVTYGHTGDSRPLYVRRPLQITATGGFVIPLDQPPSNNLPIAHGQGLPIQHFRFDCTTGKPQKTDIFKDLTKSKIETVPPFHSDHPGTPWWVKDADLACAAVALKETRSYDAFEQSYYSPCFPGMTGGQQQFGAYLVLPELNSNGYRLGSWRAQLYQEGCRPAHFLHPDGRRVTESDYPQTVLTSSGWIHERSRGSYWIQHTYPKSPWKDKGARDPSGRAWTFWDSQHWSLSALCQAYYLYQDPGFEILIRDLAEGWLWSNPNDNRGTSHHNVSGSARARGRVLEAGSALAQVLDGEVRERIIKRLDYLVEIQEIEFAARIAANETPIIYRKDGASIWEHALWCKGLFAALTVLPSRQQSIHTIGAYVGRWVLAGFKDFSGRYFIPYKIEPNGSFTGGACRQLSMWCIPTLELLGRFERHNMTKAEQKKLDRILADFYADPPLNGGYGDQMKWRLFK